MKSGADATTSTRTVRRRRSFGNLEGSLALTLWSSGVGRLERILRRRALERSGCGLEGLTCVVVGGTPVRTPRTLHTSDSHVLSRKHRKNPVS